MIRFAPLAACFAFVPLLIGQEPRDPAPPSVRKLEPAQWMQGVKPERLARRLRFTSTACRDPACPSG
jgi:hypothetical protein